MRYLITTNQYEPYFTEWYDSDKFNPELDMVVYDLTIKPKESQRTLVVGECQVE